MSSLRVVRSDVSRRQLKIISAAVEGYSTRFFTSLTALPTVLNSLEFFNPCKLVTQSNETNSKFHFFLRALHDFLNAQLSPSGWTVVVAGDVGFSFRYAKKSIVILHIQNDNFKKLSCVVIVYKSPWTVPKLPGSILSLRDERLSTVELTHSFSNLPNNSNTCTTVSPLNSFNLITLEILSTIRSRDKSVDEPTKVVEKSFNASDSVCPNEIFHWGFLELSRKTQEKKLKNLFNCIIETYNQRHLNDIQQLAKLVTEELTILAGPMWSVFLSRKPNIYSHIGLTPIIMIHGKWCHTSLLDSNPIYLVAFQLCAHPPCTSLTTQFVTAIPYAATALICFIWMIKSRLCDIPNRDVLTTFQQAIAIRVCHQRDLIEMGTTLLVCILLVFAVGKTTRRLLYG